MALIAKTLGLSAVFCPVALGISCGAYDRPASFTQCAFDARAQEIIIKTPYGLNILAAKQVGSGVYKADTPIEGFRVTYDANDKEHTCTGQKDSVIPKMALRYIYHNVQPQTLLPKI